MLVSDFPLTLLFFDSFFPFIAVESYMHRTYVPDVMKKRSESPLMPTVPGPMESAKTFTNEKAPLIKPKPRPDTESNKQDY